MANRLQRVTQILALCLLILPGCVAISGVMPEPGGHYSLSATDSQPHRPSLRLSAEVRQRAELWCNVQGLKMVVISETHSGNPFGNTAKIIFKTSKIGQVQAMGQRPQGPASRLLGTGLVVSADGLVLTSLPLIEGASATKVYNHVSRNLHSATLVDKDASTGLVLIKIDNWVATPIAEIRIRDTKSTGPIKAGEALTIHGFPLEGLAGQTPMITTSTVSPVSKAQVMGELMLTEGLASGNAGAPAILADGSLLGILALASAAGENSQTAGKVITIDQAAQLLKRNNVRFTEQKGIADMVQRPPLVLQIFSEK